MRRNDFVIKLMSVVLFVAVAAYIGLYIYDKANKNLITAPAVRYTAEDSGSAEGYIIRNETVLTGGGSTVTLMAEEGEKLASGQAVAVHYEGESALERASEIRALQLQIKEAEADTAVSADQKNAAAKAAVLALSDAVQHRDFTNLEALTLSINKTIFSSTPSELSDGDLPILKDRLANLLAEDTGTSTIYAPVSGVFSAVVDGFEALGPGKLTDLTPSSLEALFGTPQSTDNTVLGKLITGITWYYTAVMDAGDVQKFEGKTSAVLNFTKTYNERLDMKIESIGAEENGKCVVVFSAKRGISDMTVLRRLSAQVEFGSYTGLLVPKEAVNHESDEEGDKAYIFLLTGLQAEKVTVEIIGEYDDNYIVKDGAENGTVLREGCEIIVKGKELYDGKVVGR
jgi:hypothetical protein